MLTINRINKTVFYAFAIGILNYNSVLFAQTNAALKVAEALKSYSSSTPKLTVVNSLFSRFRYSIVDSYSSLLRGPKDVKVTTELFTPYYNIRGSNVNSMINNTKRPLAEFSVEFNSNPLLNDKSLKIRFFSFYSNYNGSTLPTKLNFKSNEHLLDYTLPNDINGYIVWAKINLKKIKNSNGDEVIGKELHVWTKQNDPKSTINDDIEGIYTKYRFGIEETDNGIKINQAFKTNVLPNSSEEVGKLAYMMRSRFFVNPESTDPLLKSTLIKLDD